MNIYTSISELVGKTPLLEPRNYAQAHRLNARLLLKLDHLNPAGSMKDRIALAMINEAEASGQLKPGAVIIEPTSGNTGIGLAAIAASRGYRIILTMPESMSVERRNILKAYGADIVLTEDSQGMKGAIAKAQDLAAATPGSFIPSQFTNPTNPRAHYETTGVEIWEDTDGEVDIVVAGVGTGGTITGIGRLLKERKPGGITVIAVEPADSPVLSAGQAGSHQIQGIGAGFIPKVMDMELLDEIITIENEDAFETTRKVAATDGLLVGISSGAVISAATQVAKRPENKEKNIVLLLPDTGERYLSTSLFEL